MRQLERQRWYKRRAWRHARQAALARDLYACVRCGSSGGKLDVDHIRPAEQWPALAFDLSNLQTLCPACNVDKQVEEQSFIRRLLGMTPVERDREAERFLRQQLRRQAYRRRFDGGGGGGCALPKAARILCPSTPH